MTHFTALIAEDNPVDADTLRQMIETLFTDVQVIEVVESAARLPAAIEATVPDILLADIELQDGNTIEVLSQLPQADLPCIFVTVHDNFVIPALRLHAIDYLVKPIQRPLLKAALQKAVEVARLNRQKALEGGRLAVPVTQGYLFVEIAGIISVSAEGSYTKITLLNAKPVVASKPLAYFEKTLPATLFKRIHDSHLVNRQHITEYNKGKHGHVVLSNGVSVPVSNSRKRDFLRWMGIA